MKRYGKYKDSGISWLGEIPEHWETKRVKDVFYLISKNSSNIEDGCYIPLENIESFTGRLLRTASNENGERANLFKSGDILFNKLRPYLGKVYMPEFNGGVSGEVIVFRNEKDSVYNRYFFYRFLSSKFIFKVNSLTDGVKMPRTNPSKISCIDFAIPPLREQVVIAEYLDVKTQAIDKTIKLLEQKIQYYKELRKNIINKVITKGLDENVELTESGINRIGKIPQHWEVRRLKDMGTIETSSVNKKIEENETLIKLVNYTDVYNNLNKEITNSDNYMVVSANQNQLKSKNLKKGDVIFTPSSETIEDIGVSAVVMEDLKRTLYSYHLLRLRINKQINLNFRKYLFNNDLVQYYFSKSSTGTTRKILGLNTFYNLNIAYPKNIDEQSNIAQYLDQKTSTIDQIVKNIEMQITTLKELRKRLVNDVVTGKIKVTND